LGIVCNFVPQLTACIFLPLLAGIILKYRDCDYADHMSDTTEVNFHT